MRLKDVARIEMGASTYTLRSLLNGKPSIAVAIFQSPTANALALSTEVREAMKELKRDFPPGLDYDIVYDPTQFVRASIKAVVTTLFEALLLVVIVVIVFLQTWRASIIPLVAVPMSIVGTFGLMLAFGFSINTLTLFGMVLAIGIVVDDAIVVVENVERNIANGLTPLAATHQAMTEVSGPIIATSLVLCAVFVPDGVRVRADGPVLQPVRADHRHLDGHLDDQLAHAVARARGRAAEAPRCPQGFLPARHRRGARLVLPRLQPLLRQRLPRVRAGRGHGSSAARRSSWASTWP